MTDLTVRGLLEYLADKGGTVIDLENGLSGFGPDLTNAAEDAGLILVDRGNGMSVQDAYTLTARGWQTVGREKPKTWLRRFLEAFG